MDMNAINEARLPSNFLLFFSNEVPDSLNFCTASAFSMSDISVFSSTHVYMYSFGPGSSRKNATLLNEPKFLIGLPI